jgi:hypothetical protein
MYEIPLTDAPNQAFSVTLEGAFWRILLQTLDCGAAIASFWRGGEPVILGVRALPNRALIPYRYLEGAAGNFAFLCETSDYPAAEGFGGPCRLAYATAEEIREARNG